MHCTHCGVELAADSKFCRSCGQQVKAGGSGRKSSMTPNQLGCLILLGLVALAWLFGRSSPDSTVAHSAVGTGDKVLVEDIWRDWRANEIAAEQTYGRADLEVTGTVTGVATNLTNQAVVQFRTPLEGDDLRAFMADDARDQAGGIVVGERITLHCGPAKALLHKPFVSECRLR